MVLSLSCSLKGRRSKWSRQCRLFHLEAMQEAVGHIRKGISGEKPGFKAGQTVAENSLHMGVRADQYMPGGFTDTYTTLAGGSSHFSTES